jgi:hypothetical protein
MRSAPTGLRIEIGVKLLFLIFVWFPSAWASSPITTLSRSIENRYPLSRIDSAANPPIFGRIGCSTKENLNDFNKNFLKNPENRGFAAESRIKI